MPSPESETLREGDELREFLRSQLARAFRDESERQRAVAEGVGGIEAEERVWLALVDRLATDLAWRDELVREQGEIRGGRCFNPCDHGWIINECLDDMAAELARKQSAATADEISANHDRLRRRLLDVRVGPSTFLKNAPDFRSGGAMLAADRTPQAVNQRMPQVQDVFLVPPPGYAKADFAFDDYCRSVADGKNDDGVVVVTGVRGSGKSTLLNRIEWYCNNWHASEHRPFFLRFDLGCNFDTRPFLKNLLEALCRAAYEHCRRPPMGSPGESAPCQGSKSWNSRLLSLPRSYLGIVGRIGRWCSGNLRWALVMLMLGWFAVAALLLTGRPEEELIWQGLLRTNLMVLADQTSEPILDSNAVDVWVFRELIGLEQSLANLERRATRDGFVTTGGPPSSASQLIASGFEQLKPLRPGSNDWRGWERLFSSNGWALLQRTNPTAGSARWSTNPFPPQAFESLSDELKELAVGGARSNRLSRATAEDGLKKISQGLAGLAGQIPEQRRGGVHAALPALNRPDQGKYYVLAFGLLAVVAVGLSHDIYRRALRHALPSALTATARRRNQSVLLFLQVVICLLGGAGLTLFWILPGWSQTTCPFGWMVILAAVGVLGASLGALNHRLAPRDDFRRGTDAPVIRDFIHVICLVWFFLALVLTLCIWQSDPIRRTSGTMAVGGGLAVAALCIAQSWLPAWWDFKFRCHNILVQLGQRSDKDPGELPLVGQLASLARIFLPVGVAGPDYQALETPFLEQELKRLLHDCRVHLGRIVVLIDDVDVLPGERHPEFLRFLRPVSKVRGVTFVVAAPIHFFHLYRYAPLNDVQSTVQNVVVLGDPRLFTGVDGRNRPFELNMKNLPQAIEDLLAANMRVPCHRDNLPTFIKELAARWRNDNPGIKAELTRCGASKRELLRELDRMLSSRNRLPYEDNTSPDRSEQWLRQAKADFADAEREANPDFVPKSRQSVIISPDASGTRHRT